MELDLGDSAHVALRNSPNRLPTVDVPNGHVALSISRDTEAILPLKLNDSILVSIEQALKALQTVEVPNQETSIVTRRDADVVRISYDLGNGRVVAVHVLALQDPRVPQAQQIVHASTPDAAVSQELAIGHPVRVPELLSIKVSYALAGFETVNSNPVVSRGSADLVCQDIEA